MSASDREDRHLCEVSGTIAYVYFDYMIPIIATIFAISMIPLVFIYVRDYMNNKLKAMKKLFYGGLVLFAIIFAMLVTYAFWAPSYCHNIARYVRFQSAVQQVYTLQNTLLLNLLFYRLWKVFRETSLKLSKCTMYSWIIYTVLYLSMFFLGWTMQFVPSVLETASSITSSSGMMCILAGFWLIVVFVFKLMRIYKTLKKGNVTVSSDQKQQNMVRMVTKMTVLTTVSMSCIFLTMLMIPLSFRFETIHFFFLFALTSTVDIYTNFLCILLSYNHFAKYYHRVCGCCDCCCNACWSKCFGVKPVDGEPAKLQKMTSNSQIGSNTSEIGSASNSPRADNASSGVGSNTLELVAGSPTTSTAFNSKFNFPSNKSHELEQTHTEP